MDAIDESIWLWYISPCICNDRVQLSAVYLGSFDVDVLDVLLETVLTQAGITDLFSKFIKGKRYAHLN